MAYSTHDRLSKSLTNFFKGRRKRPSTSPSGPAQRRTLANGLDRPFAQFFKGSPLLEVIDFLERLAPFSDPSLLIRDKVPVMNKEDLKDE